ncbi:hypothetical protein [Sphingobium boeckii]|uniref:Uncharacterized protein n=1 Tax=Sphingobium boeckii TaxID=1082345 RepID=A0A7W9AF53_9SPHN|nr:hypothetical protein [Sphingobium boeckii]MBB5684448.1 hypothetical protein [Sphingobium boeckii]
MIHLLNILGRSEIDEWRDHWSSAAALVINDLAVSLQEKFDGDISNSGFTDALVRQRGFIVTKVEPHLRMVTIPVIEKIVDEANVALRQIANHHAVWQERPLLVQLPDGSVDGLRDVAMTAAPFAAGAATAVALPAMAVTTSAAWFGLVTVTAISWPVVIGGSTLAAVAFAIGSYRGKGMKDRAHERLRKSVHQHVVATLIKGDDKQQAILQQVITLLQETAREARRHRL